MWNTERVQVVNSRSYLMRELLCPRLWNFKAPWLEISEKISALQIFHDNIHILAVFKYVIKPYNIRMLANLKHLNLSFKHFNIFKWQLLLLYYLDGDLLAWLFVLCLFDDTVFALSKRVFKVIKIMDVCVADSFFYFIDPLVSLLLSFKVINSSFIWENEHEWVA